MDKTQDVILAAVHNAVNKGIRDIRNDPRRSLRKLVDLGMQVGKGPFQQGFFNDAQGMLRNSNSTYYKLLTSMARNVDSQALETFGVNIGYMSWTFGARTIREYEKQNRVNVPWTIFLNADVSAERSMDVKKLIEQGMALGIYTYFVFVGNRTNNFEALLQLVQSLPQCAFLLISESAEMNARFAELTDPLLNVLLAPAAEYENLEQVSRELTRQQRMIALCSLYDEHNADDLLSDAYLQRICDMKFPFLMYRARQGCPPEIVRKVTNANIQLRAGQRYPVFPVNLYSDMVEVDHIISDESCSLFLSIDGTVSTPDGPMPNLNAIDLPLEEIIRRSMPRVSGDR